VIAVKRASVVLLIALAAALGRSCRTRAAAPGRLLGRSCLRRRTLADQDAQGPAAPAPSSWRDRCPPRQPAAPGQSSVHAPAVEHRISAWSR